MFEAEGVAVHVTAGPEPDLPEDLEALGYVYGGALPAGEMARYRDQREAYQTRAQAVRVALEAAAGSDAADLAIVDMIHARIAMDQTGCGGRAVTTMTVWPSSETGVDLRCYTPVEPEAEDGAEADREDSTPLASPAYAPPEVETSEPDIEGVNHALHAVRTDVATRGLIRALADDPSAALTALIARLFNVLVRRAHAGRADSALAITASAFNPAGGRVLETLDGDVRRRLDCRRADWEASSKTVIAWVHGLAHGEKMGLLAELTAVSLDVREEKTVQIRRSARAEATELARLCDANITLHWTPDAPFLQTHPKGLLTGMLIAMGPEDPRDAALKKSELVASVAEQAAALSWAPASLSWRPERGNEENADRAVTAADDGAGSFAVTLRGAAALDAAAA